MTDLRQLVTEPGANQLEYFDPTFPDRKLRLYSARPRHFDADTPILLVHHGVGRNGRDYRDYWLPMVEELGVLAISIGFPEASFPKYLWYQFGNLYGEEGVANPRERWTFGIDGRLFDGLRELGVTKTERYGLFGHSAGGQFVHRMLSFGYRDRVAVAIAANAGTYAMPDLAIGWPWGLGEVGVDEAALAEWLQFPLTVMAGTEDTKTEGKHFPGGPRSRRQGEHRYARAHRYVELGVQAAARLGVACAWKVIDVADVGHDGRAMSVAAAPIVRAALAPRLPAGYRGA